MEVQVVAETGLCDGSLLCRVRTCTLDGAGPAASKAIIPRHTQIELNASPGSMASYGSSTAKGENGAQHLLQSSTAIV